MRVLVTRPESEARHWVQELRGKGFDAQPLPLIEIGSVADADGLVSAWQRLERYRAVMFVSANAVRHFFAKRPVDAHWPPRCRAWAPGGGTRSALVGAGLAPGLLDAPPPEAVQFDSETLWQQVAMQIGPDDCVLIVRGADAEGNSSGRDWLAQQLTAAGARVEVLAAYRRQPPQFSETQLAQARRWAEDEDCAWLFSSSQAIANLQAVIPSQDWSRARAVATHPRIARAARAAGFGVVCESRPSLDAVAAALESIR